MVTRIPTMAARSNQPVTLIPAQPTTLLVGDRRVAVDDWPLARTVNERRSVELVVSDDLLVIEPSRRAARGRIVVLVKLMFLGGVALAIPVVLLSLLSVYLAVFMIVAVFAFVAMIVRSSLSSMRWIRFDRRAKELVFERRVGFRSLRRIECTYPLETIRSVQLLYSGHRSETELHGAGDQQWTSYREFDGYELNLVIDNEAAPRVNLVSLSDWQWVRETGGRIADFLSVPVIDKLYHGT
jgi:hypothetical protein